MLSWRSTIRCLAAGASLLLDSGTITSRISYASNEPPPTRRFTSVPPCPVELRQRIAGGGVAATPDHDGTGTYRQWQDFTKSTPLVVKFSGTEFTLSDTRELCDPVHSKQLVRTDRDTGTREEPDYAQCFKKDAHDRICSLITQLKQGDDPAFPPQFVPARRVHGLQPAQTPASRIGRRIIYLKDNASGLTSHLKEFKWAHGLMCNQPSPQDGKCCGAACWVGLPRDGWEQHNQLRFVFKGQCVHSTHAANHAPLRPIGARAIEAVFQQDTRAGAKQVHEKLLQQFPGALQHGDTTTTGSSVQAVKQALSKQRKKVETRDVDIDISVKRFTEEFYADHLGRLQAAGISKNRLKQLQPALGFVQINTLTPAPTVLMYSIDGLDVVATSLVEGFTATWYIDTTGQLVQKRLWNGELKEVFHTAICTRHPAVARAPQYVHNNPGGPLVAFIQHVERNEEAFKVPMQKLLNDLSRVRTDLLKRAFYGSRPEVIITDQDTALLNGLCEALHHMKYSEFCEMLCARLKAYCDTEHAKRPKNITDVLLFTHGTKVLKYTMFKLCVSHWCGAVANHGKHEAPFNKLPMPDRHYHSWLHYVLFALPAKTSIFRGPEKYLEAVDYFKLLDGLLAMEFLDIPITSEPVAVAGGFAVLRPGTDADRKGVRTPQYVMELPYCKDTAGAVIKIRIHSNRVAIDTTSTDFKSFVDTVNATAESGGEVLSADTSAAIARDGMSVLSNGTARIRNPLYLAGKDGINPYIKYSKHVQSVMVCAYPFLDGGYLDLAIPAAYRQAKNIVQEAVGQTGFDVSSIKAPSTTAAAAEITCQTSGTVEQQFSRVKSPYAGILVDGKEVRWDTFPYKFMMFYTRHIKSIIMSWLHLRHLSVRRDNAITRLQLLSRETAFDQAVHQRATTAEGTQPSATQTNISASQQVMADDASKPSSSYSRAMPAHLEEPELGFSTAQLEHLDPPSQAWWRPRAASSNPNADHSMLQLSLLTNHVAPPTSQKPVAMCNMCGTRRSNKHCTLGEFQGCCQVCCLKYAGENDKHNCKVASHRKSLATGTQPLGIASSSIVPPPISAVLVSDSTTADDHAVAADDNLPIPCAGAQWGDGDRQHGMSFMDMLLDGDDLLSLPLQSSLDNMSIEDAHMGTFLDGEGLLRSSGFHSAASASLMGESEVHHGQQASPAPLAALADEEAGAVPLLGNKRTSDLRVTPLKAAAEVADNKKRVAGGGLQLDFD